jgi:DNA-binding GntR family transcriptional regulator
MLREDGRLQRTSLSTAAYDALRRRVLSLDLPPGTRLAPEELARDLGVSRTPVREAIAQLARDLLVEIAPNGAARVAQPSVSHLVAIAEVRKLLEGWAAAQAAGKMPVSEIESLRARCAAAHDRWQRTGDATAMGEADEALHEAVLRACGNPVIIQVLAPVAGYRVWLRQLAIRKVGQSSENHDEHLAILQALALADPSAAQAAMVAHIEAGTRRQYPLVDHLEQPASAEPDEGAPAKTIRAAKHG